MVFPNDLKRDASATLRGPVGVVVSVYWMFTEDGRLMWTRRPASLFFERRTAGDVLHANAWPHGSSTLIVTPRACFRRENLARFSESFVKVLALAQELKLAAARRSGMHFAQKSFASICRRFSLSRNDSIECRAACLRRASRLPGRGQVGRQATRGVPLFD